jgi:carboxyl-terminal processing protease
MNRKSFGSFVAFFIVAASALVGGVAGNPRFQKLLPVALLNKPTNENGGAEKANAANGVTSRAIEESYAEAVNTISENYADEIDYERANQAAIQGMLQTLDPHSNFFTKTEFEKLHQDQESRFYGIGVSILRHRDGVYVQSVIEGTPAARSGLRYGDRIVEVDGKDARDWSSAQVSKAVRGDLGKEVQLKVERAGANAPVYLSIVRASVPQPSVRGAFMVRPGVGYIGLIGGFNYTTSEELKEAIKELKKEGMRELVLDLRNNPGGLLDQAVKVAGEFLPHGKTIVSVRGREYPQPVVFQNTETNTETMPLTVLINGNTASASEVVSGAIQDYGRGLIVGETSFGKGLVQSVFKLPLGYGLTLTTAHYYTPYGRLIQRDYSHTSLYDYYTHRTSADDEKAVDLNKPPAPSRDKRDNAPNAAPISTPTPAPTPPPGQPIKTAAGRVFYGGGGITPDIEVKPLDVATPVRLRIFDEAFYFTRELITGQIAGLENYRVEEPQIGRFPRPTDYLITDKVLDAFRAFIKRDTESKLTPTQIDAELDYVKLRLREEIITAAYGSDAGNRVLLEGDPQVLRAVEALPEAKKLAALTGSSADNG